MRRTNTDTLPSSLSFLLLLPALGPVHTMSNNFSGSLIPLGRTKTKQPKFSGQFFNNPSLLGADVVCT